MTVTKATWLAVLLLSSSTAACSSNQPGNSKNLDAGDEGGRGGHSGGAAHEGGGTSPASRDASMDSSSVMDAAVQSDGGDDAASSPSDASMDAGADSGTDANMDSSVDASRDASMDSSVDASMDSGADASSDASMDSSVDASSDASTDAGDAETEAGSDAAENSGPTFSITAPSTVEEADDTNTTLTFTVTLSAAQSAQVKVDWTTRDGTGASAGLPRTYAYAADTLTFNPGVTQKTFDVTIYADTYIEGDKDFYVDLSNPTGGIALDAAAKSVKVTVTDNDTAMPQAYPQPALNDTGITQCASASSVGQSCPQASYGGQDAEFGRDVSPPSKIGGGPAAFDFTKLDGNGAALTNQSDDYATTAWSCVRDNVTGLVWEVKTTSGLHSQSCTYQWWDGLHLVSGGGEGSVIANCGNIRNDTYAFVRAVNKEALCGFSDWRLPTVEELRSISDYSIAKYGAGVVNTSYFPNTQISSYWSSELLDGAQSWAFNGTSSDPSGGPMAYTRLVRGGTTASGARFTENGDGTATDNRTQLMWKRCSEGQTWDDTSQSCTGSPTWMGWQSALATPASFAGKSDWRLPNIKELASLIDHTKYYSAPSSQLSLVDTTLFSVPGVVAKRYWTNSPSHEQGATTVEPWAIDATDGSEYSAPTGSGYVRLVRTLP